MPASTTSTAGQAQDRGQDRADPRQARSLGRGRHSQRRLFQGAVGRGLRQGRHHRRCLQSVAAKQVAVPTMRRSGGYALVARPLYRALRLPYEVGQIGMIIVLPNDVAGLDAVSDGFAADQWTQLAAALHRARCRQADRSLPARFKASFDADLVSAFRAAGMTRAFDLKQADFSGMTGRPRRRCRSRSARSCTRRHRRDGGWHRSGRRHRDRHPRGSRTAAARGDPGVPRRPSVLFAIVDDASGAILFQAASSIRAQCD